MVRACVVACSLLGIERLSCIGRSIFKRQFLSRLPYLYFVADCTFVNRKIKFYQCSRLEY